MATVIQNLGRRTTKTAYPGRVGIRNPQIPVNNDNFLCEAVEKVLKPIDHPLFFFQKPIPIVPRDPQPQAQTYGQGQVIEEQVENRSV